MSRITNSRAACRTADRHFGALIALLSTCMPLTASSADPAGSPRFTREEIALPGAHGLVSLDYYTFDAANHRLWVPASNTGSVALIDVRTGRVSSISGFHTGEVEIKGRRLPVGPTSVTLGDRVTYVGNRGDSSVCVIDGRTLTLQACRVVGSPEEGLAAAPDAITYVAATRELWVTRGVPPLGISSPDRAITVLDASVPTDLKPKDKVELGASAEGFAVDNERGRFYTSLEELGETVSVDVHTHRIVARWRSGCDEPHGLALDSKHGILFVACMARVVSMNIAHDGRILGSISTGSGLDNIDYLPSKRLLFAAAADAAVLTVARVDKHGIPHLVASWPTERGARGVVVDSEGSAFVMDPVNGRILKLRSQSDLATR